ncbi:MAG: hypothetical protein II290_00170 [Oscillospiraceae bacterium]|nr:hypothetical protein [Oscillospiraceae bacterium]
MTFDPYSVTCFLAAYGRTSEAEFIIFHILFVCVGCLFFYHALFGSRIVDALRKYDHLENVIKPRKYGVVGLIGTESVLVTALCFSVYYEAIITMDFLVVMVLVYTVRMVGILSVRMDYIDGLFVYRSFRRMITFPPSEISKITREMRDRSVGYTLVIYLFSGQSIEFSHQFYSGLEWFWDEFKTKTRNTGDGSLS